MTGGIFPPMAGTRSTSGCGLALSIRPVIRGCRGTRGGKIGTVYLDHGVYLFPDTNAHFLGEKPQQVYSVRFAARALWGGRLRHGILFMWTRGTP